MTALAAGWVVLASGCATRPRLISKLVDGQVVVTRSIDPAAYEHVARSRLYQEEARYDEAVAELRRALIFDPESPELLAELAELELALGRTKNAERAVKASLGHAETVDARLAAAHLRQSRGDHRGAVTELERATQLADFKSNADLAENAFLELAMAQVAGLDPLGARNTLRKLNEELPGSISAKTRLAAVAWALGQLDETEQRLRDASALEPNDLDVLLMLGWLETARGQTADADRTFREILNRAEGALDVAALYARFLVGVGKARDAHLLADDVASGLPTDTASVLDMVELERSAGLSDRALTRARAHRASTGLDDADRARLDLAIAGLLERREPRRAAQILMGMPASVPGYLEAQLRAAALLRTEGELGEARRVLGRLDAEDDASLADEIAVALAQVEKQAGNLETALGILGKALAARPGNHRLRLARAALLEEAGHWKEALAAAEDILQEDPGSAEALNFWGFVAAEHNHALPLAEKRIRSALVFDPGSGAIIDSLGWVLFQRGAVAEAAPFLEQAARLDPEDPEILSHLAALYSHSGDRLRAMESLRKALDGKPALPLRQRLEQELRRLQDAKGATSRGVRVRPGESGANAGAGV